MSVAVNTYPYSFASQITATPLQMPSGLGWDNNNFELFVQLFDVPGLNRASGRIVDRNDNIITPESLFNRKSTALSNPGATFYVDVVSGNDSNSGTLASPFKSINVAITAANTAGVPTAIYVKGAGTNNPNSTGDGVYPRANSAGGTSGVVPTVDIALIAYNGRVVSGTFDLFSAPSKDGTETNTYSYTTSNTDRVVDLLNLDEDGNYVELINVGSGAICNITPGSWSQPSGTGSGTLYIQRADGAAVTNANTRVYRAASYGGFYNTNQVNVYIGDGGSFSTQPAFFPISGFDFEGAASQNAQGCVNWYITTPNATKTNILVCKNVTAKYAGGAILTNAKAFGMDSHVGLAAFFNCRGDCAATDGFNHHNTNSSPSTMVLTVNCTAVNNGRSPNQSNNAFTNHDTCIGIDVAGYGNKCHGGSARSVGNARYWFGGTEIENDRGDICFGGYIPPTAFSVGGSAIYWCDRTKANMPAGSNGYTAESSGAIIYLRDPWPTGAITGGPGLIAEY